MRTDYNKLKGLADLKNTADLGSALNFSLDSGLHLSRSSDCGPSRKFE